MKRLLFLFLFTSALLLTAQSQENLADGLYAEINTNRGTILVELEYERAPLTVCNFVALAEGRMNTTVKDGPFYDGLRFHRVIADFMIQGGDPRGNGTGGPGYQFFDEIDPALTFDGPGVLAMANSGPGTNGSQFFITHVQTPWLNGNHTIFGHVIQGQSVVNSIRQRDTIQSVNIIRKGPDAENFRADQESFNRLLQQIRNEARQDIISEIENKWPNAVTDANGIRYIVKTEGTGPTPEIGTQVTAHYSGSFIDGRVFDSSFERGTPFTFELGRGYVIEGWDLALQDMQKGETRLIILPPELAYGERGAGGGMIPPDSWLIFEVQLVDF